MSENDEVAELDRFRDIVLSAIEKVFPTQWRRDDLKRRILSGNPQDVDGKCSYGGSVEVAQELTQQLSTKVYKVTSGNKGTSGHVYLFIKNTGLIVDPSAGQFIPPSSRTGYEKFFKGNMFIGPRDILKKAALEGVVNTRTPKDAELSFNRIWGEQSLNLMPGEDVQSLIT